MKNPRRALAPQHRLPLSDPDLPMPACHSTTAKRGSHRARNMQDRRAR